MCQHPFRRATLHDGELSINFAEHAAPGNRVAVTVPLARDEAWTPLAPGALQVFVDGAPQLA